MEKIYPYLDIIFLILIILFLLFFFIRLIGKKVGFQRDSNLEVANNILSTIKNVKNGSHVKEYNINNKEVLAEGSLNEKIHKLSTLDNNFKIKTFLSYCKDIFNKIIINYSMGNLCEIKDLLTDEMYEFFKNHLKEEQYTTNNRVINRFLMVDIVDIEFETDIVNIKVIYITKQTINEIISEFREYWLLSKNLKLENDDWKLTKVLNA